MKVYREISLKDYIRGTGNKGTASMLNNQQIDRIEMELAMIYPDGISEIELWDILYYDEAFIPETLGYDSWEQIAKDNMEDIK